MSDRTNSSLTAVLAAAVAAVPAARARGDAPPTTAPAVAARDKAAVTSDLGADLEAFQSAFTGPQVLVDATARKAAAPQVAPAARRVYADYVALAAVDPAAGPQCASGQTEFTTILSTFGDADATARLAARADSKDPAVAADARANQLLVGWWSSADDAAAQAKVADQVEVLARAHADSAPLTMQLVTMAQIGPATPALAARMQSLVNDVMKNDAADQARGQIAGDVKLAALADKPMTISGKLVGGQDFTTADWKGKVVLVDFWATWCGPCRAGLPGLKQVYADYHGKGLEVLGVSNDHSAVDLTKFVADDKGMPWPQLFDAAAAAQQQWNSVTLGYGIEGIPTLFLIDKKGVCRSVTARETMRQMIPKLLDEK